MRADARLTALLTAVGAVAVGAAIQVADGYGEPTAFAWLAVAVVAMLLAVVLPTHRTIGESAVSMTMTATCAARSMAQDISSSCVTTSPVGWLIGWSRDWVGLGSSWMSTRSSRALTL